MLPRVGLHDVRVRAICSAISHGTEMLVYRGQVDQDLALDLPTLRGSYGFPIKFGYASVGRVEEVGEELSELKPGDLVFVHHPHQSAYVVPAEAAVLLPEGIDPEAAVLLANMETALNIVLDARPTVGGRVVIFGQGVVGLLVTQALRRAGLRTILAVDAIARRRELATSVGADRAVQPGEQVADDVLRITEGAGADLAIEVSGNPAALDLAINCVRFQGTIVVASWYGTKPVTLHLGGAFHRNRLRLISSQVSRVDPALGPAWTRERRLQSAIDLLQKIAWQPLITHRFALADAPVAYKMLDQHPEAAVQALFTYV
jgi:2-desacetyl-2-hydroxyethyl bacteriochlorophyllide A dehydrogenase